MADGLQKLNLPWPNRNVSAIKRLTPTTTGVYMCACSPTGGGDPRDDDVGVLIYEQG
jgi:hypothetical protein